MTNLDKVLHFIESKYPHQVTNTDIFRATGIRPHQQVFQLTQKLLKSSFIQGTQIGNTWRFWAAQVDSPKGSKSRFRQAKAEPTPITGKSPVVTPAQFEAIAAEAMGHHLGVTLDKGKIPGVNKTFDLVSPDHKVVGDAKYFTMVRGKRLPPAKFSVIAEYVWLLEHTDAKYKFLVFGNDKRVPDLWLDRYGNLVSSVQFYFLGNDELLHKLNSI